MTLKIKNNIFLQILSFLTDYIDFFLLLKCLFYFFFVVTYEWSTTYVFEWWNRINKQTKPIIFALKKRFLTNYDLICFIIFNVLDCNQKINDKKITDSRERERIYFIIIIFTFTFYVECLFCIIYSPGELERIVCVLTW